MHGEILRDAVDAFVLAGGRSRRMGRDKVRLDLDGVPLGAALQRRLAPHVRRVWLVAKRDSGLEDLGLPLVYDAEPEPALVHGVRAALTAPGPAWRFIVACDMPGVGPRVLDSLWTAMRAAGSLGSAPRLSGRAGPEPVPSLWHRSVAARVGPGWGLAARDWVRRAGLTVWDVPAQEAGLLVQCNTPAEWSAWLAGRHDEGGS